MQPRANHEPITTILRVESKNDFDTTIPHSCHERGWFLRGLFVVLSAPVAHGAAESTLEKSLQVGEIGVSAGL